MRVDALEAVEMGPRVEARKGILRMGVKAAAMKKEVGEMPMMEVHAAEVEAIPKMAPTVKEAMRATG